MIVASVICYIVAGNAWSMMRNAGRRASRAKYDEHMAQIETMLEAGEFRELAAYIEYWDIDTWSDEYEQMSRVLSSVRSYAYAYDDLLRLAFPSSYDRRDRTIENLTGDLASFTDSLTRETYGESPEDKAAEDVWLEKMTEDLSKYLVVWCGVSEEDAERFFTLSPAKQAIILEEAANVEDEEE